MNDSLTGELFLLELENRALRDENEALVQLVGVLSQPRVTDSQVQRQRDALLLIQTGRQVH